MLKRIFYVSLLVCSSLLLNSCLMSKLINIKPMDAEGVAKVENRYLKKVENALKVMEDPNRYISSNAFDTFSSDKLKEVEEIEKFYNNSSDINKRREKISKIVANAVPNIRKIITAKIRNFSAMDYDALYRKGFSSYLKSIMYDDLLKSAQQTVNESNISFDKKIGSMISSNQRSKIKSLNASLNKKLIAKQIVKSFFGILKQQE